MAAAITGIIIWLLVVAFGLYLAYQPVEKVFQIADHP